MINNISLEWQEGGANYRVKWQSHFFNFESARGVKYRKYGMQKMKMMMMMMTNMMRGMMMRKMMIWKIMIKKIIMMLTFEDDNYGSDYNEGFFILPI